MGLIKLELKDTTEMMCSEDYKERFKAEYYQTAYRLKRLKKFNNKIVMGHKYPKCCVIPEHDCPDDVLFEQEAVMEKYLDVLEKRAIIEGIEL